MAIIDIACSEFSGRAQRRRCEAHRMMLLKLGLQASEDLYRFLDTGFGDVDLLETPGKGSILLEDAAVLLIGRRTDASDVSGSEYRFQ